MSEQLEEEFSKLRQKLEESETGRLGVKLGVDMQPVSRVSEEIEEFKAVYKKLLEGNAYKRAVDLLHAKLTFERLAVQVREIDKHVDRMQEQTSDVTSSLKNMVSSISSQLTQVIDRLNREMDARQHHRERELETLKKIDGYIDNF